MSRRNQRQRAEEGDGEPIPSSYVRLIPPRKVKMQSFDVESQDHSFPFQRTNLAPTKKAQDFVICGPSATRKAATLHASIA